MSITKTITLLLGVCMLVSVASATSLRQDYSQLLTDSGITEDEMMKLAQDQGFSPEEISSLTSENEISAGTAKKVVDRVLNKIKSKSTAGALAKTGSLGSLALSGSFLGADALASSSASANVPGVSALAGQGEGTSANGLASEGNTKASANAGPSEKVVLPPASTCDDCSLFGSLVPTKTVTKTSITYTPACGCGSIELLAKLVKAQAAADAAATASTCANAELLEIIKEIKKSASCSETDCDSPSAAGVEVVKPIVKPHPGKKSGGAVENNLKRISGVGAQ